MKRAIGLTMITLLIGLSTWQLFAQPPKQTGPEKLKPFMQRKLDHAKGLLEGLATEDYEKIAKDA